jgi:threonine/homoserine/homoserine lactone efflux protein
VNAHYDWPIANEYFAAFLAAVILIELTPGPNMGYLAALAMSEGRAAGLRAVAGVTLGLGVYLIAAVLGVAEIVARAPLIYELLRAAGALYMLVLAWDAWRGAAETSPGDARLTARDPFLRGLVANLLNPKAALFYVALLPAFTQAEHGPFWRQAALLGSIHLAISVAVHGAIVIGAARLARLAPSGLNARAIRRSFGVAIALIAVWVFWSTARS